MGGTIGLVHAVKGQMAKERFGWNIYGHNDGDHVLFCAVFAKMCSENDVQKERSDFLVRFPRCVVAFSIRATSMPVDCILLWILI